MTWTKLIEATRPLLFAVLVIGLAAVALWFGARNNTAEANATVFLRNAVPAATFAADPSSLGAIPDNLPATPRNVTFNVSGINGAPSNVEVSHTYNPIHSWAGDINAVLIAPNGTSFVVYGRTGQTGASAGDSSDLSGPYNFKDSAAGVNWWTAANTAGAAVVVPPGDYRTTQTGPQPVITTSPVTNLTAAFSGVANPNGTWTLRFTDNAAGDTGSISAATLTIVGAAVPSKANMDYDGDGKTDWVVGRGTTTPLGESASPNMGSLRQSIDSSLEVKARDTRERGDNLLAPPIYWYTFVNGGAGPTAVQPFGDAATDFFTPNDYDGDGKTDLSVWRPGAATVAAFYILQSTNNTVRTDVFGQTGDDPAITGDYDGDGKADVATFRCPAFNTGDGQCFFFFRGSNANPGGNITYQPWGFGEDGDFFVNPGDFDGDGKHDFCIQRTSPIVSTPAKGQFVLLKSGGGVEYVNWGQATDFILPGDYDGDGKSDFCVRRTVLGVRQHFILERDGGVSEISWGITGDVSVPGDYDGDGKQDLAIWRANADPTQNFFWVRRSSDLGTTIFEWGQLNDVPPASWYVH